MKIKSLLLMMAFSATAFIANASPITTPTSGPDNKKMDISGGVIHSDTKKPLCNVSVTAYSNSKKEMVVLTDAAGNYSFSELKTGTYKLVFEKAGFKKVTKDKVSIHTDEGYQLNIEMEVEEEFQIIPGQLLFSDY